MNKICPECDGYYASERRCRCGKFPSLGSSRGYAEGTADTTNAERSGDRGVQPAADNGISFERIAEVVRGLRESLRRVKVYGIYQDVPRITEAIDLLEAVAKQTSAASTTRAGH